MATDQHGLEVLKKAGISLNAKGSNLAIQTIPSGGQGINPLAKYLEMTETSTTVETYEYYVDETKATQTNTITVTYTDATKETLSSVKWG